LKQEYLNLIRKYVNGLADPREKSFVEYLFSNYENDLTLRNYLSNEWEEILSGKLSHSRDLTHVLNKIHGQMGNDYQKPEKPLRRRFFRTYEKIAAVILIPVLLAFSFVYHRQSVIRKEIANKVATSMIYAPVGSRVSFSLPDGTTGMLNNDSHLTFSLPFTHNRHVTLEGEAWFDVKKDEAPIYH
jgi:ferric-dicitrate binding protein FerR (iron transport regulator)